MSSPSNAYVASADRPLKPAGHGGSISDDMAWEPSPIPHSESLEEYRFGTVAASPERDPSAFDEPMSDAPSSRESSVDGSSVDGGWYSVLSGYSTSTLAHTDGSTSAKTSSTSVLAAGTAYGTSPPPPSANALKRRTGLFRMSAGAQTAPIPPSLMRTGSLPSTTSMNNWTLRSSNGSSSGSAVNSTKSSSPLIRAASDQDGASSRSASPAGGHYDLDATPTGLDAATLISRRATLPSPSGGGASVPARLGSPVGRPPLPRRDSSSWVASPLSSGSSAAPSGGSSSYFPSTAAPPPSSFNAPATSQPMTPDTPTVVLSRPSPLKATSAALAGGLAQLQNRRGFPFPTQAGSATPPATPRTLLTLPAKSLYKAPAGASAGAGHAGSLSPHLLDDHVLNPHFNARYELRSSLGSGGYGFVCIAVDRQDAAEVAVKFILKAKVPAHSWVEWGAHGHDGDGMPARGGKVPMECELLIRLKHWGIVAGLACFADDKFFYLVQELHGSSWGPSTPGTPIGGSTPAVSAYVPDLGNGLALPSPYAPSFELPPSPSGSVSPIPLLPLQRPSANMERRGSCDLFECVELHKRFSEGRARMIFTQIVETVHYLAVHKIYHRDIKDENIVVDRDFRVKLIDFGSAVWERGDEPTIYKDFYGTTAYASAEILAGGTYQASHAEVWSLGILLNILITGESPFSSPANAQVSRRSPLRSGVTMSAEATDLVSRCLDPNPATRLSIDGIRGHRWLGLSTRRR